MKMPIEWHQECLANMKSSYARTFESLILQKRMMKRNAMEIVLLEKKIESAIKEGKDGFDAEKYKKVKSE